MNLGAEYNRFPGHSLEDLTYHFLITHLLRLSCGAVEVSDTRIERCPHKSRATRRQYSHSDHWNSYPGLSKSTVDKFSLLLVFTLSFIGERKANEPCHPRNRRFHKMPSVDQFVIHKLPSINASPPPSSWHPQPQQYQDQHHSRGRGIFRVVIPSHPPEGSSCAAGPGSEDRSARARDPPMYRHRAFADCAPPDLFQAIRGLGHFPRLSHTATQRQ